MLPPQQRIFHVNPKTITLFHSCCMQTQARCSESMVYQHSAHQPPQSCVCAAHNRCVCAIFCSFYSSLPANSVSVLRCALVLANEKLKHPYDRARSAFACELWIQSRLRYVFCAQPWIRSIPETDPTVARWPRFFWCVPRGGNNSPGSHRARTVWPNVYRPGMPMKCVLRQKISELNWKMMNTTGCIVLICLRSPSKRTEQFSLRARHDRKWNGQRKMCSSSNQQLSQRSNRFTMQFIIGSFSNFRNGNDPARIFPVLAINNDVWMRARARHGVRVIVVVIISTIYYRISPFVSKCKVHGAAKRLL